MTRRLLCVPAVVGVVVLVAAADVRAGLINVALDSAASESSIGLAASKAVDGIEMAPNVGTQNFSETGDDAGAWWKTDLGAQYKIDDIRIVARDSSIAGNYVGRLNGASIYLFTSADASGTPVYTSPVINITPTLTDASETFTLPTNTVGRSVEVAFPTTTSTWLDISEIQVNATIPEPGTLILLGTGLLGLLCYAWRKRR